MILTLQEATGKNVMLLPLGACDDDAHSQNEKMDRRNYIEGVSIAGNKGNNLRWENGLYPGVTYLVRKRSSG